MSTSTGYSRLQIALHWAIAALIVANYLISEGMEDAFDGMMEGSPVAGFGEKCVAFWGITCCASAIVVTSSARSGGRSKVMTPSVRDASTASATRRS